MLQSGKDLGDLVQIARAEGKKVLKGVYVRVVDADRRGPNEWVVQVSDDVSESKQDKA